MNKEAIKKATDLIRKVYLLPGGEAGGPLHIVLDDYNVEKHHIKWCLDHLYDDGYEYSEELKLVCKELAKLMLTMTEEECLKALGI